MKNILKDKTSLTAILSLLIFSVVFIFSPFFYTLNKSIQNSYYHIKEVLFEKSANKNIVVIEIDEKTLANLWRFPFDRSVYVPFLQHLLNQKVAVIGLDIIFADKSKPPESDILLAKALEENKNVVLWHAILDDGSVEPILPEFQRNVVATWFFPPLVDARTNTVYSLMPFFLDSSGHPYFHFSIALLKAFYAHIFQQKYDSIFNVSASQFSFNEDIKIPFSRDGWKEILINFISGRKFQKFSFYDIYDTGSFDVVSKKFDFKDKIILVWTAAKWIKDIFYTPNGTEYGVYIHANTLNTILQKDFLVYFDTKLEWLLLLSLIVVSVYFNLSRSSFVLILSNLSLIIIFLLIIPVTIIVFTNIVINYPSEIIFSLIMSLTSSNLIKYLIENKEKGKLNKALSEYVSEDIAREILSGEGKVKLDGEKKYISIFFSDIQGFTTISEAYSPEGLLAYLREYIKEMSDIIIDKRGFINKYEWDAIVALWGVFWHTDTIELDSCDSALTQLEQLKRFNIVWMEKWFPEIHIRIGLHAGDVVVGNIGTEWRKMEFTALGDAMNLASRLEGVNKVYWTQICVSEVIEEKVHHKYELRFLDRIRVKWKKLPVNIYELVGEKGKIDQERLKTIIDFWKWVELYTSRKFDEARGLFEVLASLWDIPSQKYLERCKYFLENPPLSDWDGVWEMKEK